MKTTLKKSSYWAVIAVYMLITFEFFYMASPFALYFYSLYRPGLTFLEKIPAIAWITGFFLPHRTPDRHRPDPDAGAVGLAGV